jgi:hypothetical protein
MSVMIRLTQKLHEEMVADLRRAHPHATERVGFLFGRLAAGKNPLVLMTHYRPIPDEQYIEDEHVGARINGNAIRGAMQASLDTGDGVFHTHLHEWSGRPGFSFTDERELPRLVPGFQAVARAQANGLFLLSPDSAIADVWLSGDLSPTRASRVSVAGYPMRFFEGEK